MAEAAPAERITPEKRRVPKERGIDDYKRKIWKLKKELEEQRELSLHVQNDELEKLRKSMLEEQEKVVEELKLETRNDLLHMRTSFSEKEAQLSRTIKQRDGEAKILKQQSSGHCDEVRGIKEAIESAHQDTVSKLQREIKQLKQINQDLQQKYQTKQQDYRDKISELRTCEDEFESERQKLLKDALTVKLSKLKRDQEMPGNSNKERDLQQRVTELTVALKRMEKRSDALKEENTMLKKVEAGNRELEEQCAKLRRRNAELANTVKSTGEKNKQLQVSNKKSAETADAAAGLDHAKKLFARQRAKDFAEHAKVLLNKDKEIEKLSKKTLLLSDDISNRTRALTMQSHLDMSTALRQGTKERMILEMRNTGSSADDSESRATLFNMQADYDSLQDKHDELLEEKRKLQREFEDFRSRLGEVEQELGRERKEKKTIHEECAAKDKKCVQLTASNNSVTKERDHLTDTVDKLTEEISLSKRENKSLQRTIDRLTDKNRDLSKSLEVRDNDQMQHLESNINSLTDQLHSAKRQLKERTSEVEQLKEENAVVSSRVTQLLDSKQSLKSQVTELNNSTIPSLLEQSEEFKTTIKQLELKNEDLREEREELLTQCDNQEDVTSLLETAKLNILSLTEELSETKEVVEKEQKLISRLKTENQTEIERLNSELQQTIEEKKDLELNRVEAQRRIEMLKTDTKSILATKDREIEILGQEKFDFNEQLLERDTEITQLAAKLRDAEEQIEALQADLSRELSTHNSELLSFAQLQDRLETTSSNLKQVETTKKQLEIKLGKFETINENKDKELLELVKVKERIEQDFRELESSHNETIEKLSETSLLLEKKHTELEVKATTTSTVTQSLSVVEGERNSLMSERENLKKLVVQRENEKNTLASQISQLIHDVHSLQGSHLEHSNLANSRQSQYESAVTELDELKLKHSELEVSFEKNKQAVSESKKQENHAKKKLVTLKQDLTSSFEDKLRKLNEFLDLSELTNKELKLQLSSATADLEEQSMKQISVYAADNCYHLYIVKHAFDPSTLNDSNDSPLSSPAKSADRSGADSALSATERIADISVNPGDYVFVSGELSEEGFYEGQLLDGRTGLIPSNVLEPLYEFDIYGFVVGSVPEDDLEESCKEMSEFNSTLFNDSSLLPSTPRPLAPYPRKLTLERQLANGILVGWDSPEGHDTVFVYHVYVDGKVRATLNGKSKCKALIEGVKSTLTHRVFVTATTNLGESDKNHCTIVIGEPHRPPSDLRVTATNSETAHITFLPHNSSHHHFVSINEERVRNLAPGLFQVDVAGLFPQATYNITVTASDGLDQSITSNSNNKKPLATSIQFTMPSLEEITDINGGQLESSFLQKFDQFLEVVSNGSPTPPVKDSYQIEPGLEDADFLKSYDAGLSSNGHLTSSTPNMISHSTPKFVNKLISGRSKIEENFSPIVLDLDSHGGTTELSPKRNTPTSHDKSNSESTATLGASELTPVISNRTPEGQSSVKSTTSPPEQMRTEKLRENDSRSPSKSRASPLQNKHSLQKMIKSLANKDKSRNSTDQDKEKGHKEEGDSTPSRTAHKQREKPGEKRSRHQKRSPPTSAELTKEISQSRRSTEINGKSQQTIESARIIVQPRVRSFKALYDYEPILMSPNRNAALEELRFKADDIINIYGEADQDGFFLGEIDSRRGYVPSNLVEEFHFDDELRAGERKMLALYEYDPNQLSPNTDCEQELGFHEGDIVVVRGEMDEDGFFHGYLAGKRDKKGLVPSNFLKPIN